MRYSDLRPSNPSLFPGFSCFNGIFDITNPEFYNVETDIEVFFTESGLK